MMIRGGAKYVAPVVIFGLFLSGCYVATDYAEYPEGVKFEENEVAREWRSNDDRIELKGGGVFTAVSLKLQYFECPSGGVYDKSGRGVWKMVKGGEMNEISLRFSDGCTGSLWGARREGELLLWSSYSGGSEVLILKGI
jgi:hypothetical protein